MKLAESSATPVTYDQLKALCACLAFALAAQVSEIPLWLTGIVCAAAAIRLGLAARGRGAPPRVVRLCIAVVSIALLLVQYRTFNGLVAGTALLGLMAGLKLLETQSHRDFHIVVLIIYFLNLAALLRSESFWLLGYLTATTWLTSAALLRLTLSTPPPRWQASMRRAGRILAQALPLTLIFWLFFPRFDGPLWQMSDDRRGGESGLSDSMSPGDISDLAQSDDIAFRVHYVEATPPPLERYYRGPVLHDFDGHTWRRTHTDRTRAPPLVPAGVAYRYTLSLERHPHNWLFALDWPARWDLPGGILTSDYTLVQPAPVSRPADILVVSYGQVRTSDTLSPAMRRRDTRLPPGRNPLSILLAQQLRSAHPDDMDFARAVLDLFRRQPFFYTLRPPPLAKDSVDEFLFETRRGFCGHYASAFATLMRAAGIPARVVTGYQGGTFNPYADYWILRQSDAHAWNEIWIEGRGWVRIDPTSAIAPERVERDLSEALAADEPLAGRWQRHSPWIADLLLRLDALGQQWRRHILQFDQKSQDRLLVQLRIPEPDAHKLVMVLAFGLTLALAWLTWQVRREMRPAVKDPIVRAYARLCRKMANIGVPRRLHEGAEAYAERVAELRPDLAAALTLLCRHYTELRYGSTQVHARQPSQGEIAFISGVRAFRPQALKHARDAPLWT
jgi:transglutaminase-like putative cysteine protease